MASRKKKGTRNKNQTPETFGYKSPVNYGYGAMTDQGTPTAFCTAKTRLTTTYTTVGYAPFRTTMNTYEMAPWCSRSSRATPPICVEVSVEGEVVPYLPSTQSSLTVSAH